MRRSLRNYAAITALAIFVVACGGTPSGSNVSPTPAGSNAGQKGLAAGTYKFGYVGPLTGAVGFAGVGVQKGIDASFQDVNQSGLLGAGVKLEFVAQDDANDQA